MKPLLKYTALRLAASVGVFTVSRWATRRRLRIFAYHGVSDQAPGDQNFDGFFVSPAVFEAHLRTLRHHYNVRPLSALLQEPWPDRAAAITFDDGYADNAEIAAPLLAKYDLPATFFVTTGFIDGTHFPWWARVRQHFQTDRARILAVEAELRHLSAADREGRMTEFEPGRADGVWRFMSWDQLRQLQAAGHEIGAHTVSHISLGHESPATVEQEIAASLHRLQEEIGAVSPVYSYPYGEAANYTPALADRLRRFGCTAGLTTAVGLNSPNINAFQLKRLSITGNHDRYAFRALAAGLRP